MEKKQYIKNINTAISDFVNDRKELQNGVKRNLVTKYNNINESTFNGFRKNTINTIAGLSGHGKTTLALNLACSIAESNDTDVLVYSLENPAKDLISKIISGEIQTTIKDLDLNPDIHIDEIVYEKIAKSNIKFIEETASSEKIYLFLDNYLNENPDRELLLIFDHMLLIDEENDNLKISNMSRNLIKLKNRHKHFTAIILSQLNDSITDSLRVNGSNPFPSYQDIYNGRQLYQASDIVIAIVKPSSFIQDGKSFYGRILPITVEDKGIKSDIIYCHFIKGRFTSNSIIAFKDIIKFNELEEMPVPYLKELPKDYKLKLNSNCIIKL